MQKPLYYNELFIFFAYMVATPRKTSLVFFFISQYVNEHRESRYTNITLTRRYTEDKYLQASPGGEYRSRTGDLLRARQAL